MNRSGYLATTDLAREGRGSHFPGATSVMAKYPEIFVIILVYMSAKFGAFITKCTIL